MKNMIFLVLGIVLGVYLAEAGVLSVDQIQSTVDSVREWIQSKMATANNLEVIDTV